MTFFFDLDLITFFKTNSMYIDAVIWIFTMIPNLHEVMKKP